MPHFLPKISVVLSSLILSACGGSSGGGGDTPKTNINPSPTAPTFQSRQDSIIKSTAVSDSSCPNGGVQIEMGIDANGNGLLDQAEIDNSRTEIVCHGKNAVDPIPTLFDISQPTAEECEHGGKKITLGSDTNGNGLLDSSEISHNEFLCNALITVNQPASLISTLAEPAGENCTNGGTKVIAGLDNNSNQKLDNNEVQTTTYVCTGGNGTNGTDGSNGLTSLIATTTEIAGENCAAGGTKIETGLDINGNNVLEANEITATSYICSGSNGSDGQDGTGTPTGNSAKVLIASIKEAPGSNCLHGGYQHQIGSDLNQDNILQNNEVTSSSYSCNPNQAPSLEADSQQPAVPGYRFNLRLSSDDSSDFGYDPVEIVILEKPDWLEVTDNSENDLYLSGIAAGNIGDSFTVKASSTDTDLTTEKTFTFDLVKGIYVSVEGNDVIEGNLKADGTPEITPAEFRIKLSEASEEKIVVNFNFNSSASLPKKSWKAHGFHPVNGNQAIFEAGEIEKIVPISVFGNNSLEFIKAIALRIEHAGYYSSSDQIRTPVIYQNMHTINITNDDTEVIRLGSDENLRVNLASWIGGVEDLQVTGDSPEYFGHEKIQRGDCNYYCLNYSELIASSTASVANIGESFTLNFSGKYHQAPFNQEVTFQVVEGDTDGDGVLNSADAFPTIVNSHTDSDQDGLGDEWEMANFESLELADGTTDFDNNGTTDLQAFLSDTPINDLNFDFESGELPNGWINTGDVNWVVTQPGELDGNFALKTERALAPGESANIEFTIHSQTGDLKLSAWLSEPVQNSVNLYFDNKRVYLNSTYSSSFSKDFETGEHLIEIRYLNQSSTHNAPVAYIDRLRNLQGWIPADRDGDGAVNSVDLFPDNPAGHTDSDNDGIGDEWELSYFGTLDRLDGSGDYDNDGMSDADEFAAGLILTDSDTDDDGSLDGTDKFPNNSRYQNDSDKDGLADKWELDHFGSLTVSGGAEDSDTDGKSDLEEFNAGTPPTPDADNDNVADVLDAFPDNPRYQYDQDNDGMADSWERGYTSNTTSFYGSNDNDQDGYTNYQEFINQTNPYEKNLNAVDDIVSVSQGQRILLEPILNDISSQTRITIENIEPPTGDQAAYGVLSQASGQYYFTASDRHLGWLRLTYQVTDSVESQQGHIYLQITKEAPPTIRKVVTHGSTAVALFSDGSLYGWGSNISRRLGFNGSASLLPTKISGLPRIKDVVITTSNTLAYDVNNRTWEIGSYRSAPIQRDFTNIKMFASLRYASYLGLRNTGEIVIIDDHSVTKVHGAFSDIISIATGTNHLIALTSSGTILSGGGNSNGQLGNNSTASIGSLNYYSTFRSTSTRKLTDVAKIFAGYNQSFAINESGQLYAWGENSNGQLGDGSTTDRTVPVPIALPNGIKVKKVAIGETHTLILGENNTVYGTGHSDTGALAGQTNLLTPTKLLDIEVANISAGGDYSFIITPMQQTFGFGSNTNGSLGNGTVSNSTTPVEVEDPIQAVISEPGKEGFEWGSIPPHWLNQSNRWQIVDQQNGGERNTGRYAIKSSNRIRENRSGRLSVQLEMEAGNITFAYKTSTEAEYDKLVFSVNGVSKLELSGENDWQVSDPVAVPAGLHRLEWAYIKDGGTDEGQDAVWIDDIVLPIDSDGDGTYDQQDAHPFNPDAT